MKQTIILIICIVVLVVGGIVEIKYLEKSSTFISADIDYIENAIQNNNYDLAEQQMEKTYNTWTKNKDVFNIFIIHDEIDDIDEYITELKEYIKFENKEECIVAISKLREALTHTVDRQKLKIDNIL